MRVQVKTDHDIHANDAFAKETEAVVLGALGELAAHVTLVEVRVTLEAPRKGVVADKRCVMEARVGRHQPIAVSEEAATADKAVEGAARKLRRLLEHAIARPGLTNA